MEQLELVMDIVNSAFGGKKNKKKKKKKANRAPRDKAEKESRMLKKLESMGIELDSG